MLKRFISQTDGKMPSYRCHRLHVTVVASFSRRESYSISARSSRDLLTQQFLQPKSLVSEKWALKRRGEDEEMREISRFPLVNRRKYYLRTVIISNRYVKSTRIKRRENDRSINKKDLSKTWSINRNSILRENYCSLILFFKMHKRRVSYFNYFKI